MEQTSKTARQSVEVLLFMAVISVFAVLAFAGCGSPSTRISRHVDQLKEQWATNVTRQANLTERTLDWNKALNVMLAHNLKLRQARTEVTNANENVRQIFKDLIPTLNGRAGVSKQIADFSNIGPDDVTISADSFFNIPGVVGFSARYYAAQLYRIRAEAAYQLAEREQTIELYRLFFSSEELRDQQLRLETQRAAATA